MNPDAQKTEAELHRLNIELSEQTARLLQMNQTLLDSEQRLRLAIETGQIGLWVWNSTDVTNSGDWSRRLKEIFWMPQDAEVTHEMFLERVHLDDRERVDRSVMQALGGAHGGEYISEYRIVHPVDRSQRWVTARGQAFFDSKGVAVRFIGTVMDITERKREEETLAGLNLELERRITERTTDLARTNQALQIEIDERKRAQEALKRSEDYLRLAIDTIPILAWSAMPDGRIEYLNKRWIDYTGLTSNEASNWGWQTAIHPDDLPSLLDYWKSILASGTSGETEARLRRFDGVYRWFLFRGVPLYDDSGRLTKWYGTNTDVEALRASEHLARGQMEALKQTLTALSRESEPEKFLEHVLRTIGGFLGAHSIGVWEMNEGKSRVELVAHCEGDKFHIVSKLEIQESPQVMITTREHPVWSEFFRSGKYCVVGEIENGRARVRVMDGSDAPWHDWLGAEIANPNVPLLLKHLSDRGVVATLSVPMFVAGIVTGLISIRFQQKREFRCEEIELTRALAHQAMLAIHLMRLSQHSREAAVAAERNRLARDIHDTLAQGFTGVIIQLEAAADATSKGLAMEAGEHLDRARDLARESLNEARRSVRALRPQALEDKDLGKALEELIRKMSAGAGLRAEFRSEGAPRKLPVDIEENLLRIGQEVVTNVLRHAQASQFTAWLIFNPDAIRLEFCDDGCGFDRDGKHDGFGLIGMEERVREMGGQLAIQSVAGVGTAISIVLPVREEISPPSL